jgi:hypothetical protein
VRRAELHNGPPAIEIKRPVKASTVKTVRIVNGETSDRNGETSDRADAAHQRNRAAF